MTAVATAPGTARDDSSLPVSEATARFRESLQLARGVDGTIHLGFDTVEGPQIGSMPPIYPEWLGDHSFNALHGVRFPYIVGAMANGIATTDVVVAAADCGCIGFFGAAGLAYDRVERSLDELDRRLGPRRPWGSNLIHSPNEPELEAAVADLYLRKGVRRVSASAYMNLTPAIVRYAYSGVSIGRDGPIRTNHVFAKVSRPEVARRFIEPAPAEILDQLEAQGLLSAEESRLARTLPVAEDITAESDSGGHTDNRPLGALLPALVQVRDQVASAHGYHRPVRIGAAGGLGTPRTVASAFAMGAAYVLTGSVNQACVESGLSPDAKQMLAAADLADVMMAPAADMFELGVDVQVLRRGTMFGVRARKLYELYGRFACLEALPGEDRSWLENQVLGTTINRAWDSTRSFWANRDPAQNERAEADPRHRMALIFRSYLGQASQWAIEGRAERRADFQIWCGPAMGAFNAWTAGTFLADPANRTIAQVAANLLEGAAVATRAQQLRSAGVFVPSDAFEFRPRPITLEVS